MKHWANCAYELLVREQRDTTLCFYQLIVFIDIVRVLKIQDQFNDAHCETIVRIIRANLTDAKILSAYFQSFLTNITASDVKEILPAAATATFFGYNYGPQLVKGLAMIVQAIPVGILKDGLIECATLFVDYLTDVSFSGAILIGVCIHSYFHPSGETLPSLPPEYSQTTGFRDAAGILFGHATNVAAVAATNKFTQTKNFFKSIFERVESGIEFTEWSVKTARYYYTTTGARGALTDACATLTARTLEKIHNDTPITTANLAQLSSNLTAILTQIGQLPEFADKVTAALTIGKIDCTDADVRDAIGVDRPLCIPVSGALTSTIERMQKLDDVAKRRQQELLAPTFSQEPVLPMAAAAAVLGGVSQPPQVGPQGPNSLSVHRSITKAPLPPSPQLGRPPRYGTPGFQSKWGAPVPVKNVKLRDDSKMNDGGSSKHKKKHPRSTNKRKLLVKRVRRRSMKNKNKGKW
jgi:hypothetical protein